MSAHSLVLAAVGDVFINRPSGPAPFTPSLAALGSADLRFANSEGVYADAHRAAITAGIPVVASIAQAAALEPAKFDVASTANNHTMDAGAEGLVQTLNVLEGLGILSVGSGPNLAEARRAARIERNGIRISFLAYSSVYRPGYAAKEGTPGIAAMRAHTHFYYPDWHPTGLLEPGTPPYVRTFPYPEDLAALRKSIELELESCEHVVVSFHWGQTGPSILHDYEFALGRAAVDAGASLVLGHHPHFLRAAEIYKKRPILYGLSHFAFDLGGLEATLGPAAIAMRTRLDPHGIFPREGYPLLPFHPDARMTVIAFCRFFEKAADREPSAYLLPCIINPANQPVPVDAESDQGREVTDYLRRISQEQGLATGYAPDGPMVDGLRTLSVSAS